MPTRPPVTPVRPAALSTLPADAQRTARRAALDSLVRRLCAPIGRGPTDSELAEALAQLAPLAPADLPAAA